MPLEELPFSTLRIESNMLRKVSLKLQAIKKRSRGPCVYLGEEELKGDKLQYDVVCAFSHLVKSKAESSKMESRVKKEVWTHLELSLSSNPIFAYRGAKFNVELNSTSELDNHLNLDKNGSLDNVNSAVFKEVEVELKAFTFGGNLGSVEFDKRLDIDKNSLFTEVVFESISGERPIGICVSNGVVDINSNFMDRHVMCLADGFSLAPIVQLTYRLGLSTGPQKKKRGWRCVSKEPMESTVYVGNVYCKKKGFEQEKV